MEIEDIKELVSNSDITTSATREEASEMLFFGRVNQWDGFDGVQLEYRGQFDIVKRKRNKILSELWASPPSVQFKPKDGAEPETAEILNGKFRNDMIRGEEAIETMIQDQVDCGFGAFRFNTEYVSSFDDVDDRQRIRPTPINEANNTVYMDSGSKTKDKSDARWGLVITTFTTDSWKSYCEENGIKWSDNKEPTTFKSPNESNNWLWNSDTDKIKVGEFYHRVKKRERVLIFEDPIGTRTAYKEKEIKSKIEELEAGGFTKVGQKYADKWEVTKYLVDGQKIIKTQRIPGEYIPIVCAYGDWSFVEGRELWRGIYYDAQDGQRLHNALMSYAADIVMKGPRRKPILPKGMIEGQEHYWYDSGPDDNYPYKLINEASPITGNPYPAGSIDYTQPPDIPAAQIGLMQQVRQNIDDVTGSVIDPMSMMNGQVTEGQIMEMKKSSNMESFLYRNSLSLAMKQAGRIYMSQAKEVYDTPQEITITKEDGTEDQIMLNDSKFDYEASEEIVENDISKGGYEVYVDSGPSYASLKEQAEDEMRALAEALRGTPEGQIALLSYLSLKDDPGFKDIRKWSSNQLILQGIKEPETDEEKAMLQQAQSQPPQPDPNMVLAQAEMEKAKADQAGVANDQAKTQVDAYNAETKRIDVMSGIEKDQASIAKTASEIKGNELDNVQKLADRLMPVSRTMQ